MLTFVRIVTWVGRRVKLLPIFSSDQRLWRRYAQGGKQRRQLLIELTADRSDIGVLECGKPDYRPGSSRS
jgi:hypothetical protein